MHSGQKGETAQCPSTDKWINKMWSTRTVDYYPGMKRNEVLTHATTLVNLIFIMLSEIKQTQRDK